MKRSADDSSGALQRVCNEISSPGESMSSFPLVECVITKPSLDYETLQHMVRGGDPFDVLL